MLICIQCYLSPLSCFLIRVIELDHIFNLLQLSDNQNITIKYLSDHFHILGKYTFFIADILTLTAGKAQV